MTDTTTENQDISLPNYVDLSSLPAPQVIEELDFETIFAEMLADFKARSPDYDAFLESDPVVIALQVGAYREVLLRHRINEAAKASMLAYASGSDLDNLAAFYNIERMIVEEEDLTTTPPTSAVYEDDARLRLRTQLAMESITTAGSENAYLFHALSATTKVKSVQVSSPSAGQVLLSILSTDGDGVADQELIDSVKNYVSADDKRPLTDEVVVESAEIIPYEVKATIYLSAGPSIPIIEEQCNEALSVYVNKQHTIGGNVAYSGICSALHSDSVKRIDLETPKDNIITTKTQAPYCTGFEIEVLIDE